ncbi:cytochrome P450 9e2-like [Hylaeus anthracinus]|uniref:cytochrome P450 9e2-like n=1 Tax=Hylaeus anthracinus TaxID=313031 RepID=UPI0023B9B2DA|nr:cytochrome P450 9e2-like [Hylaeus anthracinus]
MDSWTVALASVVVVVTWFYFKRTYNFFNGRGIPQTPASRGLTNFLKIFFQRMSFNETVLDVYNVQPDAKYVGFYDLMTPVIAIRDIELMKSITVKHFEHFQDHRSLFNDDSDPLFSKNLFALRGDRWREVRTLLSPAFTSSKMKAMFNLMIKCANRYGDILCTLPEGERTLELKDAFTRYTNDVIATCAFGVEVDSMSDRNNKFYVYGREATNFSGVLLTLKFFAVRFSPYLSKLLGIRLINIKIVNFFKEMVADTIKYRDENNIVRPDMIQLMMETRGKLGPGKELTIDDMTAQAFVFFFGGFESTSTLMCFAAYEVGVNPEIQKKLQKEIDEVLENCKGEPTYDAINDMKYLDAIIYEALRMYPVIVAADRVCTKAFELPPALPGLKPYVIQEGEYIWIPIYGVHYDPEHFEEPNKFNPERFLDDPKKIVNSGTFLGFGIGPRMCIGNRFALLETKVLLFNIFARCNLKPCSKTLIPMELSKKGFQMASKNGYWFDIEPRKDTHPVLVSCVSSIAG